MSSEHKSVNAVGVMPEHKYDGETYSICRFRGDYKQDTSYTRGDIVMYVSVSVYLCVKDCPADKAGYSPPFDYFRKIA